MSGRRLVTERLILRPVRPTEAAALLNGRDAGLLAGAGWPHADTLDALRMGAGLADEEGTGWFVVLAESGAVIGECGWCGGPDASGEAEIGYGLAAPYRGRRYGSEAVAAMLGWCVEQPGVRRLTASVLPANVASRRLLERLGFGLEGPDGDHVRYVLPAPFDGWTQ